MSPRCDYYLYCWVKLKSFSHEKCYFFSFNPYLFMIFFIYLMLITTKINVPNVFKSEYLWGLVIISSVYLFLTPSSLTESRGWGAGALPPRYPWARVYWHNGLSHRHPSSNVFQQEQCCTLLYVLGALTSLRRSRLSQKQGRSTRAGEFQLLV